MSGPEDGLEPLLIYANLRKRKAGWMVSLILGLAAIFVAVFRVLTGEVKNDWAFLLVGVLITALALLQTYRVFSRRPLLILDGDGLTDQSSPFAAGFIAREEIEAVVVFRQFGSHMLGLRVRDREAVLARMPRSKANALRGGDRPEGVSFVIPGVELGLGVEQLAQEISTRYNVPIGVGPDWGSEPGED